MEKIKVMAYKEEKYGRFCISRSQSNVSKFCISSSEQNVRKNC